MADNTRYKTFVAASAREQELVNLLILLFRTASIAEQNNESYLTKSEKFYNLFRSLTEETGKICIKVVKGRIFIGEKFVRFDTDGMVRVRVIIDQWYRLGLGGIVLDEFVERRQIDKFIYLIARAAGVSQEELSIRLIDLGVDGITLLPPEKEDDSTLDNDERLRLRRVARATFFRAIAMVGDIMARAAEDKDIDVTKTRRVVHAMVDNIIEDESALIELTAIRDFDEYTYVHSTNVCIYSLTIGIHLGLNRESLSQLGFAALFHDLGKVKLPGDLIKKPDVFDEDDWIQMQKHPRLGAKTILRNLKLDENVIRAALVAFEHHINIDYSGYPLLVEKRPTNLFSRIVAIADTFDALTSGRVYIKSAIPPDEVMRKMMYQMTVKFDAFLLKLFANIIGAYPAGTLVLLSSRELALVAKANREQPVRPVVRLIGNASGLYDEYHEIDLSLPEHQSITVERIIDPAAHNIDIKRLILVDEPLKVVR